MSFTTNIKNEITNIEYPKSEAIAELSSIININGTIEKESFSIYTENFGVSRRIYKLIKDLYNVEATIEKEKVNRLNKNFLISIIVDKDIDNNGNIIINKNTVLWS